MVVSHIRHLRSGKVIMSENINLAKKSTNTYDEIPYESNPFFQSHPERLRTIGYLFGMNPVEVSKARILELGCASGGNIIPIAYYEPNSKIVGIDNSQIQVDVANDEIKYLNLKNIEVKCCSILDLNESIGKFDYIIVHGIFSWVPAEVRKKIFEICNKCLTEQGIAYISYNTLPGWNMVKSIRDMMLYHSSFFNNIHDKINQSKVFLNFVGESLEGQNSSYARLLKEEINILSPQPDSYLRHDHLEDINQPYYFNNFMKEASDFNLQYLADASIASMFLGNMPPKVIEQLKVINDIIRLEQYMDFIYNRRFRSTLLCKKGININRALSPDDIYKFYLTFKVKPEKDLSNVDLNNNESLKFYYNDSDTTITTTSSSMKSVLSVLATNINNPLKFDEIVMLASKKIKVPIEQIKSDFLAQAMQYVLKGLIAINLNKGVYVTTMPAKPKVSPYTVYQSMKPQHMWVTNSKHERIGINFFDKYAIKYMDGSLSKDDIIKKMMDNHVDNNDITLTKDNKKTDDKNEIKKQFEVLLNELLIKLLKNCLFVV